jgi:hydroxymethylglutaryl-CoA synthase
MAGIVSYGTYIPQGRIRIPEIARVWKKDPDEIVGSLGVKEKSVPGIDEDAVTLAVEAAASALRLSGIDPETVGALFVGSESHPYAVNPTSTTVGEFLGLGNNYLAADLEFACKAATAGIQAAGGLIDSGQIGSAIVIGSDTAQSKPHDALEYASAAGSAAFVMGSRDVAVRLQSYVSYSSDTPDFWRRDGIRFPSHAGRFTGEPAYFAHVMGAARLLFDKTGIKPREVSRCVFHMPNGKFPRDAAKRLGFSEKQLEHSLIVERMGNPYSASSLLGLCATLDRAAPGEYIFMVSYGSGAGSDGFLWQTTDKISALTKKRISRKESVEDQLGRAVYTDYVQYLKQTHKI